MNNLPAGVGVPEVQEILLQHAALPEKKHGHGYYGYGHTSERALLKKGEISVADGSTFPIGIGASGVSINYETTIIKANEYASNGVIHFIDTVIIDGLL